MPLVKSNNKRLAINTIVLYVRMMVVMGMSFYTTRVVLQALGAVDYGLMNAIGSVVAMFSFISISCSTACSRYFSFEIGRNDNEKLSETFAMIFILYIGVALVLIVGSETIGLWYVNHKLIYPVDKTSEIQYFYQLTVLSVVVGWMAGPYSALIVSYENMALYAWLSVFDASMRLVVALAVQYRPSTMPLVKYGSLLLISGFIQTLLCYIITRWKYSVSRFRFFFDRRRFNEICSFSGWNLVGSFSWASSEVFVNLLLNAFFGPIVNAARAISACVSSGVSVFTQNFLTAVRPQIVKAWASENKIVFWTLFKRVSKLGYLLLLIFVVPLIFELDTILSIWLSDVPTNTVIFTRIVLLTSLINSFSFPITYAAQAVGKLALFEGFGSGVRLFVFPCSYLALKLQAPSDSVFWIVLVFTAICVIVRFIVLARIARLSITDFVVNVLFRLLILTLIVFACVWSIHYVLCSELLRVICTFTVSISVSFIAYYFIVCEADDKQALLRLLESTLQKLFGVRGVYGG